jgi:uncharacterized membrane protein YesL
MRRIPHAAYETLFGVVYLGLMTNLLLLVGCLPVVVLLMTTDPAVSWPLLVFAAPSCAPALVAAFTVFREQARGGAGVVRAFVDGWRAGWRRALALGVLVTAVVVVLLIDVRAVAGLDAGVLLVPVFGTLAVLVVAVGLLGFVAVSEEPGARLRDVLRVSAYLAVRRWYLTGASLAVLGVQGAFFAARPALAIGLSAAPLLYVVWANSRYSLRPVLTDAGDAQAVPA